MQYNPDPSVNAVEMYREKMRASATQATNDRLFQGLPTECASEDMEEIPQRFVNRSLAFYRNRKTDERYSRHRLTGEWNKI